MLDQFLAYLNNLAHLSLGVSPRYNMPVAELIGQRLPGTLMLMGLALALALLAGSRSARSWPGRRAASSTGSSRWRCCCSTRCRASGSA